MICNIICLYWILHAGMGKRKSGDEGKEKAKTTKEKVSKSDKSEDTWLNGKAVI